MVRAPSTNKWRSTRDDARRKILIGAVILAKIEPGEFQEKKLRAMLGAIA